MQSHTVYACAISWWETVSGLSQAEDVALSPSRHLPHRTNVLGLRGVLIFWINHGDRGHLGSYGWTGSPHPFQILILSSQDDIKTEAEELVDGFIISQSARDDHCKQTRWSADINWSTARSTNWSEPCWDHFGLLTCVLNELKWTCAAFLRSLIQTYPGQFKFNWCGHSHSKTIQMGD